MMEVMGIREDYGLLTEQRVLHELKKRHLPCRHRCHIGDLEVDILVGERICVEVDGYYHALKGKISQDAAKERSLEARGYVVLRITGNDAKQRRKLREFADHVEKLYRDETRQQAAKPDAPLTTNIPGEALAQLRVQLEQDKVKKEKKAPEQKKLTDEELFRKAIDDLLKRGRK